MLAPMTVVTDGLATSRLFIAGLTINVLCGCANVAPRPNTIDAKNLLREVTIPGLVMQDIGFLDALKEIQQLAGKAGPDHTQIKIKTDFRLSIVKRGKSTDDVASEATSLIESFRSRYPVTYYTPFPAAIECERISLWDILSILVEVQDMQIETTGATIEIRPRRQVVYLCNAYEVGDALRAHIDTEGGEAIHRYFSLEAQTSYVAEKNILLFISDQLYQVDNFGERINWYFSDLLNRGSIDGARIPENP